MENGALRVFTDGTPCGEKGTRAASTGGTPPWKYNQTQTKELRGHGGTHLEDTHVYEDAPDDLQSYMHNTPYTANVNSKMVEAALTKLRMQKKAAIIVAFILVIIASAAVVGLALYAVSLDGNKNATAHAGGVGLTR